VVITYAAASAQSAEPVQWKACPAPIQIAPTPYCPQVPQVVPEAPTAKPPAPQPQVTPEQPSAQPPTPAETPPSADLDAARAGAGLGETFAMAGSPNMFGDQLGTTFVGPVIAIVPGKGVVVITPGSNVNQVFPAGTIFNVPTFTPSGQIRPAGVPLTSPQPLGQLPVNNAFAALAGTGRIVLRGSFKIAENDSPRPQDRVFGTYNYFYDVNGSLLPPGFPITTAHREEIGFEKTFLHGNASFEMRVPFFQIDGDGSVRASDIGDLSFILKYAFINNRDTGNVLSGGFEFTAPTGINPVPFGALNINPWILQPYGGFIYNFSDRFYTQGFTSIAVPTDSRDVTLWFNDLAVGYFLYRNTCGDRLLSAVVPTFEVHVTTPLNHRGALTEPIGVADIVDLTAGVTFGLGRRSTLGFSIVSPVTGPKPFDLESMVQLNFRF
jgi:hypothetical protein